MMDVNSLRIISWNVNSVKSRTNDIHYYVHKNSTDILLLQETGDKKGDLLNLKGYRKFQLLSADGIRGLSTYIKNSIPSELLETPNRNEGIESICVKIYLQEGAFNIINLYVSKDKFCVEALPDTMFSETTLVAGDFNARHRILESEGKMNTNGVRRVSLLGSN